jgi:PhnB protein
MAQVRPIPDGYHTVTPFLVVDGGTAALDFYRRAFGATERYRMPAQDGRLMHAEIQIGDSVVMLSDSFPEMGGGKSPKALGGTASSLLLYVPDVDAAFKRAVEAGATARQQPENMFWGDRFGKLVDPFGHEWQIATHVEDVSPEEMGKRAQEAFAG